MLAFKVDDGPRLLMILFPLFFERELALLVALQGASIWKEVEGGTVRQVFIIDRRSRLRIEVKVLETECQCSWPWKRLEAT